MRASRARRSRPSRRARRSRRRSSPPRPSCRSPRLLRPQHHRHHRVSVSPASSGLNDRPGRGRVNPVGSKLSQLSRCAESRWRGSGAASGVAAGALAGAGAAADVEDLIHLRGPLTEDAVVRALQTRFYQHKFYVS